MGHFEKERNDAVLLFFFFPLPLGLLLGVNRVTRVTKEQGDQVTFVGQNQLHKEKTNFRVKDQSFKICYQNQNKQSIDINNNYAITEQNHGMFDLF